MPISITTFTLVHVVLSLLGIVAGLVVIGGLISGRRLETWTGLFLGTTFLTNLTGFGFPFPPFLASHGVGAVCLVLVPLVAVALYWKQLKGGWRRVFVVGTVAATYLNVFVLLVQLFRKVPAMIVLAPTQSEPPFAVTQLLVLALFVWMGRAASRGFVGEPVLASPLRQAVTST
jgi:hypothetical protein